LKKKRSTAAAISEIAVEAGSSARRRLLCRAQRSRGFSQRTPRAAAARAQRSAARAQEKPRRPYPSHPRPGEAARKDRSAHVSGGLGLRLRCLPPASHGELTSYAAPR
jgi:hypothetical protein